MEAKSYIPGTWLSLRVLFSPVMVSPSCDSLGMQIVLRVYLGPMTHRITRSVHGASGTE